MWVRRRSSASDAAHGLYVLSLSVLRLDARVRLVAVSCDLVRVSTDLLPQFAHAPRHVRPGYDVGTALNFRQRLHAITTTKYRIRSRIYDAPLIENLFLHRPIDRLMDTTLRHYPWVCLFFDALSSIP